MTLLDHFRTHGWARLQGAFSPNEAAAMREAVWRVLSRRGIRRDNPATWKEGRPAHLQELKDNPVFQAAWGKRTIAAIDEVMEGAAWQKPISPGAHFIAFPGDAECNMSRELPRTGTEFRTDRGRLRLRKRRRPHADYLPGISAGENYRRRIHEDWRCIGWGNVVEEVR
jgi:hypothetical protein